MGDFHNRVEVKKSRKQHICCTCGSGIAIGSKYIKQFGVYSGNIYHSKSCVICEKIQLLEWNTGCYQDGMDVENLLSEIDARKDYLKLIKQIPNKSLYLMRIIKKWESELGSE